MAGDRAPDRGRWSGPALLRPSRIIVFGCRVEIVFGRRVSSGRAALRTQEHSGSVERKAPVWPIDVFGRPLLAVLEAGQKVIVYIATMSWLTNGGRVGHVALGEQEPGSRWRRPRTLAVLRTAGMIAHHGFELGCGAGLALQPELGLPAATAVWVAVAAGDVAVASSTHRWSPRIRALAAGLGFAGAAVHYVVWPWRLRRGIPRLVQAEGLRPSQLPVSDVILLGWAAAAAGSLFADVERGSRRWVVPGLAVIPALVPFAHHHVRWLGEQARDTPRWWNRAQWSDSASG